ncbi:hypothetical protein [Bacillus massiliigorillae]|uniref:hypothetical protein n=1 Tax=Bacillus massiliigorillae TaxID=1243664 RepID=UPI0003A9ADFA|nr:hypothetical protein [Bacillus massiliigorillae]
MIEELLKRVSILREYNYSYSSQTSEHASVTAVSGVAFAEWIYDAKIYLEVNYSGTDFMSDFAEAGRQAIGSEIKYLDTMEGILLAVKKAEANGLLVPIKA